MFWLIVAVLVILVVVVVDVASDRTAAYTSKGDDSKLGEEADTSGASK